MTLAREETRLTSSSFTQTVNNLIIFATEYTEIHRKIMNGNHEKRSELMLLCSLEFFRVFRG